jgi:hypothetical protein
MSLNIRAMKGYLISMGLDTNTSDSLANRFAESRMDPSMNFDSLIFKNKPMIGKKEAMKTAATSCLAVIGLSEYPIDKVQGLVACLAKKYDSVESLLQSHNFEREPISDLLSEEEAREIINIQFDKSKNKRGGLLGFFS